jgi:L-alanine-DL-glutamate epimerase-like enolase superfamily enzyme
VLRRPFQRGELMPEDEIIQTLTKIVTDEGAEGYYLGEHGHGDQDGLHADERDMLEGRIKSLLVGQDPFDREKFWHWLWVANHQENLISVVDMALWDLQARAFNLPLYKLLGGCRDKVKAYASTYPNMGTPSEYAAHALACQAQGYTHYKIHPYYFGIR